MAVALAAMPALADDPFSGYHASIEARVEEMLEPAPAPRPVEAPPAMVDAPRKLTPALARLERYRPTMEAILRGEGLPEWLVAVVLVESGAVPEALSPKSARGLWQLIPETARRYGLTVSGTADDRIQTERATRAAARYLRDLYRRFGDWPLALAGYNAGEEAVARAIRRAGAANFEAASQHLPAETRSYVPAVLAAMQLLGPA